MRSLLQLLSMLVALICISGQAAAVALPYLSNAERLEQSDVVVIAQPIGFSERNSASGESPVKSFRVVEFRKLQLIKGSVDENFEFDPMDYMAEWRTDCCELDAQYLLFLKRAKDGIFVPTNGQFSLIKISNERPAK